MKSFVRVVVFFLAMIPAMSFAQAKKQPWPEMKNFHQFMSSTFHPAEEGNFQPLRLKADSMLAAAKTWKSSDIPSDFKADETKAQLQILYKQINGIADLVHNNADDTKLMAAITAAHDTFHKIVGECRKDD